MKTITSMLKNSCEKYKNNIAFVSKKGNEKRNITYTDLYNEAEKLAFGLTKNNLNGKYIIVSGKNSYEWALSAFAIFMCGAILVPVDQGLPEIEFNRIVERSNANAIIYSKEVKEKADNSSVSVKIPMENIYDFMSDEPLELTPSSHNEESVLMFTSGTTSSSKAVMLSQENIVSNIDALMEWEDLYQTDVNLALLPFFHSFGLTAMLLFIKCGSCSVFAEGLRIKKALTEYGVTVFVGVPLILDKIKEATYTTLSRKKITFLFNFLVKISRLLLKMKIDVRGGLFSFIRNKIGPIRLIISGAAALSSETANFFENIGILIIQGYGLTEASPVLSAENKDNRRLGSVGKALPGIDVKIDSPDNNGIGEIKAKGKNIMLGYKGEASPFKDGYLMTGDLGYIDEDGFIFIKGRIKNVIVLNNGENVFPEEIESEINKIPGVKESIVFSSEKGTSIHTSICYDEAETNVDKIKLAIKNINLSLPEFKKIKKVYFTKEDFPKTSTGKIKRNDSIKMAEMI